MHYAKKRYLENQRHLDNINKLGLSMKFDANGFPIVDSDVPVSEGVQLSLPLEDNIMAAEISNHRYRDQDTDQ